MKGDRFKEKQSMTPEKKGVLGSTLSRLGGWFQPTTSLKMNLSITSLIPLNQN